MLQALGAIRGRVHVVSDSTYVVNCFSQRWWAGWRARGWRNSRGEPVANQDLWRPLIDEVVDKRRGEIRLTWVKGHSGDPMNELVDQLAVDAARFQRGASRALNRHISRHPSETEVPGNVRSDAICGSSWREGVGRWPRRLAVRVQGMGIRLPLRRARRGRHRASCPRSGHQPDRHRRDLRPWPLGADRRPRDRGAAGGGFPRLKGPADPPVAGDRRQAGGRERAAPRRRADGSLPASLAEPGRPPHRADGSDAGPPTQW